MSTEQRGVDRQVDAAMDEVLRDRLAGTVKVDTNLRDAIIAGMMDRGFDFVPIDGYDPPTWTVRYQVGITFTVVAKTEGEALLMVDDGMSRIDRELTAFLEDTHNVEIDWPGEHESINRVVR